MRNSAARRVPIALLTDFGYRDHYVGVMKGVIAAIAPDAPILDITHGIPPQSVEAGAIALRQSWSYFPRRTIFVAVVDPGVGTARRAIAIESASGARFIGPDNGLLVPAADDAKIERIVEINSARYRLPKTSSTFHGRDIFAPAASHLWNGTRLATLGRAISGIQQFALEQPRMEGDELRGTIVYIDAFGNLITNISRESLKHFAARFPTRKLLVKIRRSVSVEIRKTYGDAPHRASLAAFGSFELLEIAVREGSAADRYAAEPGMPVTVRVSR
ncbi:MAG: SAM hydrolase/SAM-dependent halogenase family protein [Candidatus Binataceae bacterium]